MYWSRVFLTYLAVIMTPLTRTVMLLRPFLKGPIRIEKPKHNFWPYIPVSAPEGKKNDTSYFQKPDHNFWPFVPVQSPIYPNSSYFDIPRHNFWPFIPVVPPGRNGTKPIPGTPPLPLPTLPVPKHGYDYGEVIYKSILFYEAQRSGWLPDNRKVTWRGHSALEDRGEYGEDLTGGWYDAGDYVKFGFPMAGATTMLLIGMVEFYDSYTALDLLDDMYDCVKWPLDYFIKAHPSRYEFYAQVADPYVDHSYWGRPEDMTMYRPAYKLSPQAPGSDIIGETAAAMAAGSIVFKSVDKEYSSLLLRHATEMFEFADRHRGLYSDSLPIVQEFYSSSGYNDELAWAAAWLYKATGDKRYLQQAEENYVGTECWAVSWDSKDCLAAILLYNLTGKSTYRDDIQRTMKAWMPGGSVDYTPGGLAFRTPWGPLRYTANMATLALIAANAGINSLAYRLWARDQIHYMLGDSGRSFVVGFGENPPIRPHHAASSCPPHPGECSWSHFTTSAPNPIILYGALVGGPAIDDHFYDARDDYYQNEVTCDYNAGFHSALAGLVQLELRKKQQLERMSENKRSFQFQSSPKIEKKDFPGNSPLFALNSGKAYTTNNPGIVPRKNEEAKLANQHLYSPQNNPTKSSGSHVRPSNVPSSPEKRGSLNSQGNFPVIQNNIPFKNNAIRTRGSNHVDSAEVKIYKLQNLVSGAQKRMRDFTQQDRRDSWESKRPGQQGARRLHRLPNDQRQQKQSPDPYWKINSQKFVSQQLQKHRTENPSVPRNDESFRKVSEGEIVLGTQGRENNPSNVSRTNPNVKSNSKQSLFGSNANDQKHNGKPLSPSEQNRLSLQRYLSSKSKAVTPTSHTSLRITLNNRKSPVLLSSRSTATNSPVSEQASIPRSPFGPPNNFKPKSFTTKLPDAINRPQTKQPSAGLHGKSDNPKSISWTLNAQRSHSPFRPLQSRGSHSVNISPFRKTPSLAPLKKRREDGSRNVTVNDLTNA